MGVGSPEKEGSPEGVGSPESVGSPEGVRSPEGVGSLGSSGSWTLLPSQPLKCTTEMRRSKQCNLLNNTEYRTR